MDGGTSILGIGKTICRMEEHMVTRDLTGTGLALPRRRNELGAFIGVRSTW